MNPQRAVKTTVRERQSYSVFASGDASGNGWRPNLCLRCRDPPAKAQTGWGSDMRQGWGFLSKQIGYRGKQPGFSREKSHRETCRGRHMIWAAGQTPPLQGAGRDTSSGTCRHSTQNRPVSSGERTRGPPAPADGDMCCPKRCSEGLNSAVTQRLYGPPTLATLARRPGGRCWPRSTHPVEA